MGYPNTIWKVLYWSLRLQLVLDAFVLLCSSGQFTLDFTIRKYPDDPPYCNSDDLENKPCHIVEELLVN